MTEDSIKTYGQSAPLKRAGQPVEAAACFVFLAGPDASYIRYVACEHLKAPDRVVTPLIF